MESNKQKTLQTRNLSIDTSIFERHGFTCESRSFKALKSLITHAKARCFISKIVINEVHARIDKRVNKAKSLIKKNHHDLAVLQNVSTPELVVPNFRNYDYKQAKESLSQLFSSFIDDCHFTTVDLSSTPVEDIFSSYFELKPPFEDKEDKKSEFPDAFIIASLNQYCEENGESMYVIAGDQGMLEDCANKPNLIPMERLDTFIDLVNKHENELSEAIETTIKSLEEKIAEHIEEEFPSLGFILIDPDKEGDIEAVEVEHVYLSDHSVIYLGDDSATIHTLAEVTYIAEATYDDLNKATWDSEDHQYFFWSDKEHVKETCSAEVTAQFDLSFDSDKLPNAVVFSFFELKPSDIEVSIG